MKAVRLIATKGAQVLVFDLNQPDTNTTPSPLEGEPALTRSFATMQLDGQIYATLLNRL
jgi:hypothetical protein